jgi:Flp pilus assembly protein TadD
LSHHRTKPSARSRPKSKDSGGNSTIPLDVLPQREERVGRKPTLPIWIVVGGATAAIILVGLTISVLGKWPISQADRATRASSGSSFVGSKTCAGCHQAEANLWRDSQHSHAMAHADNETVLGDFSDVSFDYYSMRSRFFRKDGKFFVETDGPDGTLGAYQIKYTFGIDPLQQYLIEFPDGRLQALSIAWDSRPKQQGGQRWFHLYLNEEIKHDDILHWTKLNQNWNHMCAECHSTGVRKNYDAVNDRYATTFSEISVGCEGCHGQGSRHVAWARERQSWWSFGKWDDPSKGLAEHFSERRDVTWSINPTTGNAVRSSQPRTLRPEVETCGRCHARRGQSSEAWTPGPWLSETHMVAPLRQGLYHADGQMLDEVYNYGSFKQSKMFAAGVTCSDCHEPHSGQLRAPADNTCLQCHAAAKYAVTTHHRHEAVNPSPSCASCHMPERTYMVVDRRHDHSFRVPRPDVSAKLGTPNACNDCHSDRTAEWATSAVERWHGPNRKGLQNYAEAFHAAWTGRSDAAALLGHIAADRSVPAFARASALTEFRPYVSASNASLARTGLSDPDPMVRIGALTMLEDMPSNQLWPLVAPLLSDSNRGIRISAVRLLASVPKLSQPPADRERFERAAAEFVAAQRLNADRPEARSTLGHFFARRGLAIEAEAEYRAALRLSPQFAPAAINLADLYRERGRDGDGEEVLRTAIDASPRHAGLHHALGLTLTRLKRSDGALAELRRAAEIEPEGARYTFVYAVALHSAGQTKDSIAVLEENLARHPSDRDTLMALISFHRGAGHIDSALKYAEQLALIIPDDNDLIRLIETLQRQASKPTGPAASGLR